MDRRRFLGVLAAAGLAGGLRVPSAARDGQPSPSAPPGRYGFPADICEEASKDDPGTYAVTAPEFASDWGSYRLDPRYRHDGSAGLAPDQTVIGLGDGAAARAYPISILWYHEVVNDRHDGRPVAVTYCPLCRSGMVADRRLRGEVATFRVSGLLWAAPQLQEAIAEDEGRVFGAARRDGATELRHNGNVVLIDDVTGSYWSQILATGICGPMADETLDIVPSTVTDWRRWREAHPETEVLVPPPHSGTTADAGD
jgi:hypothetical protein